MWLKALEHISFLGLKWKYYTKQVWLLNLQMEVGEQADEEKLEPWAIWRCRLLFTASSTLTKTVRRPPHFHVLSIFFLQGLVVCLRAIQQWVCLFLWEKVTASLYLLVLKIKRSSFWGGYFNPSSFCHVMSKIASEPSSFLNMPGAHWQYLKRTMGADNYHCRAL